MKMLTNVALLCLIMCNTGLADAPDCCGSVTNASTKKIYLLPVYSCSNDDHEDHNTIVTRGKNTDMIRSVFFAHVPQSNLVIYGDKQWPAQTNATSNQLGFTKNDIEAAIDACPAGPDDTIFFYWNGHGGGRKHHVLRMSDNQDIKRSDIVEWVEKRNARLSVIITDTCAKSVLYERVLEPKAPCRIPPNFISPLFEELFIKPCGLVNLTSASPGEYAIRSNMGSYFTLALAGNVPLKGISDKQVGYLWNHANSRKSWYTVVDELQAQLSKVYHVLCPGGYDGQMDQNIWVISLPSYSGGCACRIGLFERIARRIQIRRHRRMCRRAVRRERRECCCW